MDIIQELEIDKKAIKKGKSYYKKYLKYDERVGYSTKYFFEVYTFYTPYRWISTLAYFVFMFLLWGELELSGKKPLLFTIILFFVFLIIKLILRANYKKKYQSILDRLEKKYADLRNQYLENKMSSNGFINNSSSSLDITKKNWIGDYLDGRINIYPSNFTFVINLENDYGEVLAYEGINSDLLENNLNNKTMSRLQVGFTEFDSKYYILSNNLVKARNYFSASMVDGLLKNPGMISQFDFNIYIKNNTLYLSKAISSILDGEVNLKENTVEHYIEQIDFWHEEVISDVSCIDSSKLLFENR